MNKKSKNITLTNGVVGKIKENYISKIFISSDYNFSFNKKTGWFARWGKKIMDDPNPMIGLPEIADIEISTICTGVDGSCKFCYKSNTKNGTYMTFETFKSVFKNLPSTITQIAFGIGDIEANPDMWEIFDYCNLNGVKPNVTINGKGITDEIVDKLVEKCGAVAVSIYDKELSYNTVEKLTKRGLKQVNIHFMISEETYNKANDVLNDIKNDRRLEKLNAIVFLSLKQKGRAKKTFNPLNQDKFNLLIQKTFEENITCGFDSCSAYKFLKSVEGHENYKSFEMFSEPCESSLFSMYINVEGKYFPCSFMEGEDKWKDGFDVIKCDDFLNDIWNSEKNIEFRKKVIDCRNKKQSCNCFKI